MVRMCEWVVCVCVLTRVYSSFGRVYTVHKRSVRVCVCSFNGIVQAESYLLFHKGPDSLPERRHIRCHYRELNRLYGEKAEQIHPSILILSLTSTYINIFFILTVIRAKISGEKIVSPSNNSSPYMKMIQYEIKMIKVRSLETCYFWTVHQDR